MSSTKIYTLDSLTLGLSKLQVEPVTQIQIPDQYFTRC